MYLEFLKKSFQQNLTYRGNTVMRMGLSFLYLFVTMSIWQALYRGREAVDGIALTDMLTYVLISQVVRCLTRGGVSYYIADRIKSGMISIDFVRPVNLKYAAFFNAWGSSLFQVVVYGIPMMVLGTVLWGFSLPAYGYQWVFFLVSVPLAMLLISSIEYIMGLTVFWLKTDFHISWIIGAMMSLFSGAAIPLWFYPPAMQSIANALPFRFYMYEPVSIFLGKTSLSRSVEVILIQTAWIVGLNLLGWIIWRQAKKIVVVQGG